jgi:hypothetical protein
LTVQAKILVADTAIGSDFGIEGELDDDQHDDGTTNAHVDRRRGERDDDGADGESREGREWRLVSRDEIASKRREGQSVYRLVRAQGFLWAQIGSEDSFSLQHKFSVILPAISGPSLDDCVLAVRLYIADR